MRKLVKTEEYLKREKEIIGTTTVDMRGPVLRRGKGAVIIDIDGNEYLDFISQIGLVNTGHTPKFVALAIKQQTGQLHACISADWPYQTEIVIGGKKMEVSRVALAEKLVELTDKIMPFKKRVYFEVSGATTVNLALKIAKYAHLKNSGCLQEELEMMLNDDIFIPYKKPLKYSSCKFSFLTFKNTFAGRHGEAQCLTNSKKAQLVGASSSCAFGKLPFPDKTVYWGKLWDEVKLTKEVLLDYEAGPLIAFEFEPVQGEGGINIPEGNLLRRLIEHLRDELNLYIIADEIQTGFGRTGKMFACEHFGITPDMICLSKSLGAGLPIGAVVVNAEKFPDFEQGMHSSSFHAHPLSVAAAIANIDFIERINLVEKAANLGAYALERLKKIISSCDQIVDVIGLGLMIGIELESVSAREKIIESCKDKGLLLAGAGEKTIRFMPPLTVTICQLDKALKIIAESLKEVF
ncbi:MAG: hypothetical protein A2909_00400 [Candidatus Tagabacteria bacterium RIFCSPLOWO2_01_FULL_39_11]|uniref:Acetylornithine aminotransferase n=1 Tax=Candidatus Tagabacteria bacterium RIFCSPLOWO2_01_FULL_39_11 TaxID=1802295 RepID=A0A1G2LNY6_9BACT|nr:MAG: hypothetical protein A2909_00400 [Candidatus Tagabacteria bacterium RIFCSPLOWO2_01_FULL_39_11]